MEQIIEEYQLKLQLETERANRLSVELGRRFNMDMDINNIPKWSMNMEVMAPLIAAYDSRISMLESVNSEREQEIKHLCDQLSKFASMKKLTKFTPKSQSTTVDNVESAEEDSSETIATISKQSKQIDVLIEQNTILKKKNEDFNLELSTFKQKFLDLRKLHDGKLEELSLMSNNLSEEMARRRELEGKIDEVCCQIEILSKRNNGLKNDLERVTNEKNELIENITNLKQSLEDSDTNISKLNIELSGTREQISVLRKNHDDYVLLKEKEVAEFKARVLDLTKDNKEKSADIERLSTDFNNLRNEMSLEKNGSDRARSESDMLRNALKELKMDLMDLQSSVDMKEAKYERINKRQHEENDELRIALANTNSDNDVLVKTLKSKFETEKTNLNMCIDELRRQVSSLTLELEATKNSQSERIRLLETENESYKADAESISKAQHDFIASSEAVQLENTKLKSRLENVQKEITSSNQTIAQLTEEISRLEIKYKEQLLELTTENQRQSQRMQILQTDLRNSTELYNPSSNILSNISTLSNKLTDIENSIENKNQINTSHIHKKYDRKLSELSKKMSSLQGVVSELNSENYQLRNVLDNARTYVNSALMS